MAREKLPHGGQRKPFCAEDEALAQAYAATGNITRAAQIMEEAGVYSPSGAVDRFESSPVVQRVQEIIRTKFAEGGISSQRTMIELARVAFSSAKDMFDENGDLIPVHKMTDDTAASIASIDVETRWEGKGSDAVPVIVKKYRRADKMAALGILAKHFKIVGDEGDGVNALASALADRLKNARRRAVEVPPDVEDARMVQPRAVMLAPEVPEFLEFPEPLPVENDDEDLY